MSAKPGSETGEGTRVVLSAHEVDELLKPGEYVHTFIGGGGLLIGCDVARSKILQFAADGKAELAGDFATKINHGVCYNDGGRWTFAETRPLAPPAEPTSP